MPDPEPIENIFKATFEDSVITAFVITRSPTEGCIELQLYDRSNRDSKPVFAGQFPWGAMAKLYDSIQSNAPGSILVPAYTQADISAYMESGEAPPGFRHDKL